MSHVHAIVWLDHRDAHVIGFSVGPGEDVEIHSESPQRHLHHQDRKEGGGHVNDDVQYFAEIAESLADAREVLICGPGTAKSAFERYVIDKHPELAKRVVGVETLDHPTEPQLLAYARTYFKGVDQLGIA